MRVKLVKNWSKLPHSPTFCVDAQADLCLCWSHKSYCKFCHVLAQLYDLCFGSSSSLLLVHFQGIFTFSFRPCEFKFMHWNIKKKTTNRFFDTIFKVFKFFSTNVFSYVCLYGDTFSICRSLKQTRYPASILYKSTAIRYRPVRVADRPIAARCRFIKNAYRVVGVLECAVFVIFFLSFFL